MRRKCCGSCTIYNNHFTSNLCDAHILIWIEVATPLCGLKRAGRPARIKLLSGTAALKHPPPLLALGARDPDFGELGLLLLLWFCLLVHPALPVHRVMWVSCCLGATWSAPPVQSQLLRCHTRYLKAHRKWEAGGAGIGGAGIRAVAAPAAATILLLCHNESSLMQENSHKHIAAAYDNLRGVPIRSVNERKGTVTAAGFRVRGSLVTL